VSNYSAEQLRRAIKIGGTPDEGGLISIQNQYSPRYRNDSDVFRVCEEFGIAFLPWSPLGGVRKSSQLGEGSFGPFGEIGKSKGVSAYATAIAWLLHTSPMVIPIPGATRSSSVLDSLKGLSISLSESEIQFLNSHLPEDSPVDHELVDQPIFLT
jgi:aryl-alcohol dehydrogenase-like predicted oxidoreductase